MKRLVRPVAAAVFTAAGVGVLADQWLTERHTWPLALLVAAVGFIGAYAIWHDPNLTTDRSTR